MTRRKKLENMQREIELLYRQTHGRGPLWSMLEEWIAQQLPPVRLVASNDVATSRPHPPAALRVVRKT